jgi:hypothetical protein
MKSAVFQVLSVDPGRSELIGSSLTGMFCLHLQ